MIYAEQAPLLERATDDDHASQTLFRLLLSSEVPSHLLGGIKERQALAGEALECALDTACDMSLVALAQLKGPLSLE